MENKDMAQPDSRELLIRLDERLRNAVGTMETRELYHKQEMERLVTMFTGAIQTFTGALAVNVSTFATKVELDAAAKTLGSSIGRVERIVYGACGIVLLAVVGALLSGILK